MKTSKNYRGPFLISRSLHFYLITYKLLIIIENSREIQFFVQKIYLCRFLGPKISLKISILNIDIPATNSGLQKRYKKIKISEYVKVRKSMF
jgi:hypothetical protein